MAKLLLSHTTVGLQLCSEGSGEVEGLLPGLPRALSYALKLWTGTLRASARCALLLDLSGGNRRWRAGEEGDAAMLSVIAGERARAELHTDLDELAREGARRMLAAALEAEVDD